MNNLDIGERLLSRAHEYYDEMLRAYGRRSWNVVMRRAQEVVELSLKGLLKMMGVEYPKSHDVGGLFGRVCIEMGLEVESEELEVLKDISCELTETRSPAFYEERIYDKQNADKAKAGAEKVLNFAESFAKTLRN